MSVKSIKNEDIFLVKLDNDTEKDDLINAVSDINNSDTEVVPEVNVDDVTELVDDEPIENGTQTPDEEINTDDIIECDDEPLIEDVEDIGDIEGGEEGYMDTNDMDNGELPTDLVSMDGIVEVDSDPLETLPVIDNDGPLFQLAMQAMVDYHNIAVLHHNIVGGAWYGNHTQLDDYYGYVGDMVDDLIEQNIELGGREPSIAEAVSAYGCINVVRRNKIETFNICKGIFNNFVTMIEECKDGLPSDVISKLEEYQNYFRKEADYKINLLLKGE